MSKNLVRRSRKRLWTCLREWSWRNVQLETKHLWWEQLRDFENLLLLFELRRDPRCQWVLLNMLEASPDLLIDFTHNRKPMILNSTTWWTMFTNHQVDLISGERRNEWREELNSRKCIGSNEPRRISRSLKSKSSKRRLKRMLRRSKRRRRGARRREICSWRRSWVVLGILLH